MAERTTVTESELSGRSSVSRSILRYLQASSQNKDFKFHVYAKNPTHYIVYGRVQGRPCMELNTFLAQVELTQIDGYKVSSYSYDWENTCLCLTVEQKKRLQRSTTPRTRLRSLSDCPVFTQVPASSYESMMLKYYQDENYAAVMEIYERAVSAGLSPTKEMVRLREYVLLL